MTEKQIVGQFGENIAAQHLKKNHYKILKRNYRYGKNEIDLIAENKNSLIFVEVKTRMQSSPDTAYFGRPAAAVTYHKKQCTLTCARQYLFEHPTDKQIRMDVIEVYVENPNNRLTVSQICHIENAYGY